MNRKSEQKTKQTFPELDMDLQQAEAFHQSTLKSEHLEKSYAKEA